ncbi:hypothetical protein V6U89_00485 [Micromonospora sp. CPCC 206171]|uniref:hypothetical protein n=1 Tax=Micromonospora sp. CPCC 206171 TaxID=3122405 RepID=UPI002FF11EC4
MWMDVTGDGGVQRVADRRLVGRHQAVGTVRAASSASAATRRSQPVTAPRIPAGPSRSNASIEYAASPVMPTATGTSRLP